MSLGGLLHSIRTVGKNHKWNKYANSVRRNVESGEVNKATRFEACEVPDPAQSQNIGVHGWSGQRRQFLVF